MRAGLSGLLIAAVMLASCSIFRPVGSWVELSDESDAGQVSEAVAVFVAQSVPESGAVIELAAVPAEQSANRLTGLIREKLTGRGYRLDPDGGAPHHRLHYLVSRFGDQILLRVNLDGLECSVLFGRDGSGQLRASAPLAMRQKEKSL